MLILLFLLLPIAAMYGWYMGGRQVKKEQEILKNQFSREYVTGLNFLLSNQQEKAVDLFLSMLQKQELENHISSESQFEAELTLGNLFRSRGELDRALRIHQGLDNNPAYSFDQKLLAKQQLAKDFMAVGFYDRAEHYYLILLDEPEYAVHALSQLALIYQKTKEWAKAINVSEKLLKIAPDEDKTPLVHYYCEYATHLQQHNPSEFITTLEKSLQLLPECVRPHILLGNYYFSQQQYRTALANYEQIQDSDYLGEIIDNVLHCYEQLQDSAGYELFLIKAHQRKYNSRVSLALMDFIEQKDGREAALFTLHQQLSQSADLFTFRRLIQYQIEEAEEGRAKESLVLLHDMVGTQINKNAPYQCLQCGYLSHKLVWHCPSCRSWESVKPRQHFEQSKKET